MIAFAKHGEENTNETLKLALAEAEARGLDLVVASSRGDTALAAVEMAEKMNFSHKIVVVRCAYSGSAPDENRMSENIVAELNGRGAKVVTAAHALSGAERGITKVFGSVHPVELMATTLRLFGQGVKVCVEIALMAVDCGAVAYGKPVMCVAGTGKGADTACIISPASTASLLDTKINEVLCKPGLYKSEDK